MLHFDILFVGPGHVDGPLVSKAVTEALRASEEMYHMGVTVGGGIAGLITVISLLGLLYRCIFVESMRPATTRMNIVTCMLLCLPVALDTTATIMYQVFPGFSGHGYDCRETTSVWFRSIPMMSLRPEYVLDVPLTSQMYIVVGILLFYVWPFTRLMRVTSAPLGYVTWPLVTYRSRDAKQPVGCKHDW